MNRSIVRRWFAAFAAFVLLAPLAAHAADAPPQPYVVLIGVSEYKDSAITPRPHAAADVQALYDLLATKECFTAKPENIKLLLSRPDGARPSEPATRENILKAVKWALESAKEDDLVLICWIGQGAPVGDRTCYFAADSTLANRAKDAIGAAELEDLFDKVTSTRVCVLVDVNFKGYEAGPEKISETGLAQRFQEFDGTKEGSEAPPKPISFIAANDGQSPSLVLGKNGLFMTVVLDALRGKADTEGGEADGWITIDELSEFVRREVPMRAAAELKKEQRALTGGRSTHFPLTINPPAMAKVRERLARFEELVKSAQLGPEIAKEGREFLSRMPRFETQRNYRKEYQKLADGTITPEQFQKIRRDYLAALKVSRADAENFAKRVLEVAGIAEQGYVKAVKLPDLVVAAIKGVYRRIDEKIPAEIQARLDKAKELDEDGLTTLLIDVRMRLGNRDDLKKNKDVHIALETMLHSLDPYSTYVDPEAVAEFNRITKQVFIGVGIQIQKDLGRDVVRVTTPLRGSPAYRAGVKAGDLILKVTNIVDEHGKPLPRPEVTDTKGVPINDVVKKILGKEGTKVILTVEREEKDGPRTIDFEITRGRVRVETVMGVRRNEDDSWDYYLDKENKIAYVRLTQFALHTARDLQNVLEELQKQGLNGLVLDLRFNPGGYLDSAVRISDLFIDDGLIVTIRPRTGRPQEFKGQQAGSLLDFPLVVLINSGSASASEIVSACLQDHERAIIMGERSFGKGSVQNIMELNLGDGPSEMKLTTATFWRPSNKNLNKFPNSKEEDDWGVRPHPDYTIKLTPAERGELAEHLRNSEVIPRRDAPKKPEPSKFTDRQLAAALEYLQTKVTAKRP